MNWKLARCADPEVDPEIFSVMDPPTENMDWDWRADYDERRAKTARRYARRPDVARKISDAKEICFSCPIREACLAYALRTRQPFSIWGGCLPSERQAILRGRVSDHQEALAL